MVPQHVHEARGQAMQRHLPTAFSVYIAFVFVQSLFFKFADSPETLHIFGTLDAWATSLGFPGLFAPGGIFSAYVVGGAELVASILLLSGAFVERLRLMQVFGALLALGIISGAIFFHLFTPLGVNVQGDGGLLFYMACGVWLSSLLVLWLRRDLVLALRRGAA